MKNFVDLYVEYATEATDSPRIFHETIAYYLLSSVVGRYTVFLPSYRPTGIKPNMWLLIIGPSRIVRKSTALGLAEDIIDNVGTVKRLPESFSPEALFEELSNFRRNEAATLIRDEFGGFFKELNKSYMAGTREMFSALYDGKGGKRKLRKNTFVIPKGIYITMLTALPTPAHNYLVDEDFTSGFLNRFVLPYRLKRDKTIRLTQTQNKVKAMRNKLIQYLSNLDKIYSSLNPVVIQFDDYVEKELEKFNRKVEKEITELELKNPDSLWKSYIAEAPIHLMKLSVLRRIGREPVPKAPILIVEKEDFDAAIDFLNELLHCARLVIEDVQMSPRPKTMSTSEKYLNHIYNIIEDAGKEGIRWRDLLKKSKLHITELLGYIKTLMEREDIIVVMGKAANNKKVGRPSKNIYFFLTKYETTAITRGDKLEPYQFEQIVS